MIPLEAVVTSGQINDIVPAKEFPIEVGTTYVFDLGYYSFEWWQKLHDRKCRFVTRLKTNTRLQDTRDLPVPEGGEILSDRIGYLSRHIMKGKNPFTDPVREVVIQRDNNETLRLVTNDLKATARTIADLYKQRWEIELFFRWIKQNLKIRHLIGASENAVKYKSTLP